MSVSRNEVQKWMMVNHADYDNATSLAESAAHEFDIDHVLDDDVHWIWDEAFSALLADRLDLKIKHSD